MTLAFQLDAFEGPLDLLLHLITREEIDIYDIPIVSITSQFLSIIENSQMDMDRTSEFLVMAATLLEIKSKMLLPNHEMDAEIYEFEGVDPREELVRRLLNYKKFKEAANLLQSLEGTLDEVVFKEQEELAHYLPSVTTPVLEQVDQALLKEALSRIVAKMQRFDEQRATFFGKIKRDLFTVDERIELIRHRISEGDCSFDALISEARYREEVIVTFLALLELLKLGEVAITQSERFETIYITRGNKHDQ